MKATITKLVRGIYYVDIGNKVIECKARGLFRESGEKPIVGDFVDIRISDEDYRGYIEKIYPRKNYLIRPQVANIDFSLLVFSINSPDINTYLLDKNLLMLEYMGIRPLIVFSKSDIADQKLLEDLIKTYREIPYDVISVNNSNKSDFEKIHKLIEGKIVNVCGPSGVGKSTLINNLFPNLNLLTSEVSQKTKRGKHTTRHTELFNCKNNTYIFDTPGFTSLDLDFISIDLDIDNLMPEFQKNKNKCYFNNCKHINEPNCKIKELLNEKVISKSRYESYLMFVTELKEKRRY